MDGIIIVNKHKGCTSHDIVSRVKKIYNKKVGHTGTLDPMATGVLPLLIGKGTMCSKYLINHDKTYQVVLELGKKTSTADAEGEIIDEVDVDTKKIEKNNVEKVLKKFIGKQEQIPPMYSAIKVKGKKLYEYARKGIHIDIKPRNIEIYNIWLIGIKEKQIEFKVSCSKGTYIRSLCEDIAKQLDTLGFMKELKRLEVGSFKIEDAINIEQLEENKIQDLKKSFITIENIFNNKEIIELDEKKYRLFLNGVRLTMNNKKDDVYRIYFKNEFIGTGTIKNLLLKRDIVI